MTLAVVSACPHRNKGGLFKFLNSGNFLTLAVLDLLNLAGGGWMVVRRTHKKRKKNG